MTLGEIIKQYRIENNLSMDDFAEKASLSKGYISMLEKNINPKTGSAIAPSLKTIKQVCNAIRLDLDNVLSRIDQDITLGEDNVDIFAIQGIEPPPETYKVPLIGTIACGKPILAEENIEDYLNVSIDINCDFCLRCKGDSMINARINDGDIVCIKQQPIVDNGEIAAVLIDDEATLKRFYRYGDTLVLRAENPTFKDLEYKDSQLNDIRVIGKAIYFISQVK